MNTGKTKYMNYKTNQKFEIKAIDGSNLKRVEDFKYLWAWIDSSAKDLKIRKALARRTCHQMRNIWKSTLSRKMKLRLMHTNVESVLLYGCDNWTLTKTLLKQLDGTYTRILRMIINITHTTIIHWSQKVTNEVLYGTIEKMSTKNIRRFLKFAGHCLRRDVEVVSDQVLWEPTHVTKRWGRSPESYIRNLEHVTSIPASEMEVAMMNRDVWRTFTIRETTIPK